MEHPDGQRGLVCAFLLSSKFALFVPTFRERLYTIYLKMPMLSYARKPQKKILVGERGSANED